MTRPRGHPFGIAGTLAVITPERCFALLTFAPETLRQRWFWSSTSALSGVGDRPGGANVRRVDRRGVDAMLCLQTVLSTAPAPICCFCGDGEQRMRLPPGCSPDETSHAFDELEAERSSAAAYLP